MINKITICPDGHIIPDSDCLGRTGENNATVLRFDFFEDLNGKSVSDFQKFLVVILPEGVLRYPIEGDFSVPEELTACDELAVLVEIKEDDELLFKSCPHIFTFIQTGDNPEVNVIQSAVDAAKKGCCDDLSSSLETATGEAQDGKTWEELNDDVSKLLIVDEEKQKKIDGFDLVKFSVENTKIGRNGDYSVLTHGLFTTNPKDSAGYNVDFSLPYFNTSKAKWESVSVTTGKRNEYFSQYLKEIGLDCTSSINFSNRNASNAKSIFEYMKKLKLTNVTCTLYNAFNGCTQLNTLEINGTDGAIKPVTLEGTFRDCNVLIDIVGDEFDLSDLTTTSNAFKGCYILQHIRFKPFTLRNSLDFGDCRYLNMKPHSFPSVADFSTLISLLNAIPEPEDNDNTDITITLNKGIEESLNMAYVNKDKNTKLYSYVPDHSTTESFGALYDAFLMKGVTLAWKN